jgi:hypothetical protein
MRALVHCAGQSNVNIKLSCANTAGMGNAPISDLYGDDDNILRSL